MSIVVLEKNTNPIIRHRLGSLRMVAALSRASLPLSFVLGGFFLYSLASRGLSTITLSVNLVQLLGSLFSMPTESFVLAKSQVVW